MHEVLWAGAALKAVYADFFLEEMSYSLQPPRQTQTSAALGFSGANVGHSFHRSFYPNLDGFLATTRSIPEIIEACFGADKGSMAMSAWFAALASAEKTRRENFTKSFAPLHKVFRDHPLSNARNISFHRTGYSPVQVKITGRFGVTYQGSPIENVPIAESPQFGDLGALLEYLSNHVHRSES